MDIWCDIEWNKNTWSMWFPFCFFIFSPTFPWYQQVVDSFLMNESKDQRLCIFMCLSQSKKYHPKKSWMEYEIMVSRFLFQLWNSTTISAQFFLKATLVTILKYPYIICLPTSKVPTLWAICISVASAIGKESIFVTTTISCK